MKVCYLRSLPTIDVVGCFNVLVMAILRRQGNVSRILVVLIVALLVFLVSRNAKDFRESKFTAKTFNVSTFLRSIDRWSAKQTAGKGKVGSCSENSPRKSIFYVKVHKTGSTTLRSVLLVYGRKYNLTICMDANDLWGLNWPDLINVERLTKHRLKKCDIVAEEVMFNPKLVQHMMSPSAFVMASVRHPIHHFFSLFKYTRVQEAVERLVAKKLDLWEAVRIFLKHPQLVQNVLATYPEHELRDRLQINLVRPNLQLYSLGIDANVYKNMTDLENIVKKRVEHFDFIAVAEMFKESMVILRTKLCCQMEDVVYRKQNVRRKKNENAELPQDIEREILKFNAGDFMLYNIAKHRLENDIQSLETFNYFMQFFDAKQYAYESKARNESIPYEKRVRLFPPDTIGQIGVFVEGVREEQRKRLLFELQEEYRAKE